MCVCVYIFVRERDRLSFSFLFSRSVCDSLWKHRRDGEHRGSTVHCCGFRDSRAALKSGSRDAFSGPAPRKKLLCVRADVCTCVTRDYAGRRIRLYISFFLWARRCYRVFRRTRCAEFMRPRLRCRTTVSYTGDWNVATRIFFSLCIFYGFVLFAFVLSFCYCIFISIYLKIYNVSIYQIRNKNRKKTSSCFFFSVDIIVLSRERLKRYSI